ncbi:unnamed protein product [Didymodactylos carnosus]|uniref:NOT2/NOT3/NOT5 C-terminal domain-containing protein n=1 Tax=Didymodactylos carnosus TaxID=1234261 RepID=A0A8S2JX76_9BILA|nr:unnamed protein product [Didymodactylos carnosus]CAF3825837.1 unnamed protein product [Didymodactylos carnosus]
MASSSSYLHPMSGTSPSYLHMASSTYLHNMAPPGTKQWTSVASSQQQQQQQQQMNNSTTNKQQHPSQQSSQLQTLDGLTNHLNQNGLINSLTSSTSQIQLEKNFELQQEDFPPLPKSATISQNQDSTTTVSSQQTSNNLLPSVTSSSSSSQHPFSNYSSTSSNSLNGFASLNDLKQLQQQQSSQLQSSSSYHHTSSSPSPTIFKSSVDQMNTLLNRQQSIPASQNISSLSNSQHPQYMKQLSHQPSGSVSSSTSNSSSSTSAGFAALLAVHQAHAAQQQQQQNSSNTTLTSGQTTAGVIGSNGTATTTSGQTSNSGSVTSGNTLPSSTITDQYGLVGLLQIIQQAEKDPVASTLLNCDLTTLGLSKLFNQTDLYPSFISPFVDQQARPHEIDYQVPYEYQMGIQIRDKLPQVKFDQLNEDTLFFLFYLFGNDYIQISAANELYRRDWRYHKDERIWLTRIKNIMPDQKFETYETGVYCVFDVPLWRKTHKSMRIDYEKLDDSMSRLYCFGCRLSVITSLSCLLNIILTILFFQWFTKKPLIIPSSSILFDFSQLLNHTTIETNNQYGYVLLSCSAYSFSLAYCYYLPFTSLTWRRIGYEPIILLHGLENLPTSSLSEMMQALNHLQLKHYFIHTKTKFDKEVLSISYSQISRLFGGYLEDKYLKNDDFLIISDADLLPINIKLFNPNPTSDILIVNAFCCLSEELIFKNVSYPYYPISYIGMKKRLWKQVVDLTNSSCFDEKHKKLTMSTITCYLNFKMNITIQTKVRKKPPLWDIDQRLIR